MCYTVTLKVTDNDGAIDTTSKSIALINVTARGYKVKGLEKVDLSWNATSGTSYDIDRNGSKLATVQESPYTDNLAKKGSGTYTYKVCHPAGPICSNQATVSFDASCL